MATRDTRTALRRPDRDSDDSAAVGEGVAVVDGASGAGARLDESRWRQRRESFARSMESLGRAASMTEYSELERAGLIQMFEVSFELAWKTLKDLLFYEGFDVASPREVLRQAFVAGHTTDDEAATLLDALNHRNLLSHTYNEATAEHAVHRIREHYVPALQSVLARLTQRADS